MWTAKIVAKGVEKDRIALQVEFSKDGEESVKVPFSARTVEEVNNTIKQYIHGLDGRDAELEKLTLGDWTAPVVEEVAEVEPTDAEVAEQLWNTTKSKLEQALALKEMAIKSGREVAADRQKEIDQLAAFVDAYFKIEYVK